ncbi:MAG TPA: hypothetical protein VGM18_13955 [Candidatus Sulfotelmatobacter sp.]
MSGPNKFRWTMLALAALIFLLAPLPLFSQSCALCYTQAASSGSRMIQALKSGILILIVPPTLMSVGMIFVVRRKNGQVRDTDVQSECEQDW